jgi:hypothetical protein
LEKGTELIIVECTLNREFYIVINHAPVRGIDMVIVFRRACFEKWYRRVLVIGGGKECPAGFFVRRSKRRRVFWRGLCHHRELMSRMACNRRLFIDQVHGFGLVVEYVDVGDGPGAVNNGVDVVHLGMSDNLLVAVEHIDRGFFVISPEEAAVAVPAAVDAGGIEQEALGGVFDFVDEVGNIEDG